MRRNKPTPGPHPAPVFRLLRDLLARPGRARTVLLIEPDAAAAPRQYDVRPERALYVLGAVAALVVAVSVAVAVRAALRPSADDLRALAEASAVRAAALQDSLAAQAEQAALLRALITGEAPPRPAGGGAGTGAAPPPGEAPPPLDRGGGVAAGGGAGRTSRRAAAYAAGVRFPAPPPVDGVLSRGFDAARGHLAVDYAATVGTPVRAVAGGYVVLADWTRDGGHTLAVQHPGGYLSVYKHNSRLLKRPGDRVRAQETVALSGDTGEVTSGPHLHVELWRDGLAQDPAALLLD